MSTAPTDETRPPLPNPTPEQARALLRAATGFVISTLTRQPPPTVDAALNTLANQPIFGAFVSLKRHHHLRGCCGFLGQYVPLLQGIQHAAGRTAVDDHRFPPVSLSELPHLDVEVWLLDQSQPVTVVGRERVSAVTIGRHGLQIARGNQSGLLLPGVAIEQGWNSEQFLQQVCVKAGLPTTAWLESDTQLSTFEGWSLKLPVATLGMNLTGLTTPLPVERGDLPPLARHAGQNIVNLIRGAAANAYLPTARDANVCGVALLVEGVNVGQRVEVFRLDLRPNLPLQATLFELAQAVARALAPRADLARWFEQLRIGLTVLHDTALHGVLADRDLAGIAPTERGVMVVEGPKYAIVYDRTHSAEQLLDEARQIVQPARAEATPVHSFAVISTEERVTLRQIPQPPPQQPASPASASGPMLRPASQAGRFYPANVTELYQQLAEFWQRPVPSSQRVSACMVPHAGLIYSGRLAADVLRRCEIPDTVVIIGPKHTPYGVNWALAPHERWAIPGGGLDADLALARVLEQHIDGLQFDAAAHQMEHGIEVELPVLHKLAPRTKLVAIAIGTADVDQCQKFGRQLADVLRKLDKRPLLVISSDMNHFANDSETRRLDRIALDAMDKLDPRELYETVTRHNISMCGLRPAVIVMEALRQLGGLTTIEHVGYATSAEVSGDMSRAVGYAGALLN